MRVTAIIPAAGHGERMRSARPKVLLSLSGRPLLAWTLEPFLDLGLFSEILIACPPAEKDSIGKVLREETEGETPTRLVIGGQTRQESVANCLREVSTDCDLIAIHDGARPLVSSRLLLDVVTRAEESGAAIAAVPCKDTVKLCSEEGVVSETFDRSRLWLVQTPQCFRRNLLVSAYEKAGSEGYVATDDSALVERMQVPVHIVMGSYENIKVTTPEDFVICEDILRRRES